MKRIHRFWEPFLKNRFSREILEGKREASKKPRGQHEASKKPARSQQEASKRQGTLHAQTSGHARTRNNCSGPFNKLHTESIQALSSLGKLSNPHKEITF